MSVVRCLDGLQTKGGVGVANQPIPLNLVGKEPNGDERHFMDNVTSCTNGHNDSQRSADHAEPQKRPSNAVLSALRKGAKDAKEAAERAIPRIKSAAADAAYWTAYGVSFAAVFNWTLAKGLTPECVKSGVRDGVKAGRDAAQQVGQSVKSGKKAESAGSVALIGPSIDAGI